METKVPEADTPKLDTASKSTSDLAVAAKAVGQASYLHLTMDDIEAAGVRCVFLSAMPGWLRVTIGSLVCVPITMAFLVLYWAYNYKTDIMNVPDLRPVEWMILTPVVTFGLVSALINLRDVVLDLWILRAVGTNLDHTQRGLFDFSLVVADQEQGAKQPRLETRAPADLLLPFLIQFLDALQPTVFIVLSTLIAFSMTEADSDLKLLDILLNFLALEFMADIDERIIMTVLNSFFDESVVILAIRAEVKTPSLNNLLGSLSGADSELSGQDKLRALAYIFQTDPQRFQCVVEAEVFHCRQVMSVQDSLHITTVNRRLKSSPDDLGMEQVRAEFDNVRKPWSQCKRKGMIHRIGSDNGSIIEEAVEVAVDARGELADLSLNVSQPAKLVNALDFLRKNDCVSKPNLRTKLTSFKDNVVELCGADAAAWREAAPSLEMFPHVSSVSFAGCVDLTNDDLVMLAEALPNITSINLSGCPKIRPDGLLRLTQTSGSQLQSLTCSLTGHLPLHFAVLNRSLILAKLLVAAGASLTEQDAQKKTALEVLDDSEAWEHKATLVSLFRTFMVKQGQGSLHQVVQWNDPALTAQVLAAQPDALNRLESGKVPLELVSDASIARSLLEAGARPSRKWALPEAAGEGMVGVVLYLLADGGVDEVDDAGRSALRRAVDGDYQQLVSLLLEHKADVNLQDTDEELAPLHKARCPAVAELLLEAKAAVDPVNSDGETPLHIVKGSAVARVLLAHGANLTTRTNDKDYPLHTICNDTRERNVKKADKPMLLRLLLEAKADPMCKNSYGEPPLHLVEDPLCVKVLLEYKADINAKNQDGSSKLHEVYGNDGLQLVKFLINAKADLNIRNQAGDTPLMTYAEMNAPLLVSAVLQASGDPTLTNKKGKSALQLAQDDNYLGVVKLLKVALSERGDDDDDNNDEDDDDDEDKEDKEDKKDKEDKEDFDLDDLGEVDLDDLDLDLDLDDLEGLDLDI